MSKSQACFAWAIVVLIVAGLAVDAAPLAHGQAIVSIASWLLFAWLLLREAEHRASLLLCLAFATAGEVLLSLVWRLYDYRLGNLPAFVPPGHVLLFWLGLTLAGKMPGRIQSILVWGLSFATLCAASLRHDLLSLPLLALFLACLRFGPSPRLYATMFALALAMELWGTWLGNWHWHDPVPGLAIGAGNPPLAAGAFYCALDLLVLASRQAWPRLFRPPPKRARLSHPAG
ncbi:hypothetical protein [Niveibacterium terrae]|uniref:hypothetical protein n=1 Tax=Niveibacterium terrae TaxID=3373598 RepID=UPI003A907735